MDEIKKEFIPYEQALELKQLGFDEPCFGHYLKKQFYLKAYDKQSEGITLRPTFSQAFRWFRNKGFISQIKYNSFEGYYCFEIDWQWDGHHYEDEGWDEFEYAELTCLIKLIEIVKNGK